ncbi:hypothetical protein [Pseudoalteromonas sp. 2CM32C]|uniref:hypothetical protein n=1 Tax=Pseudoalteromonas sp. 2CM32C TaxID=2929852 RepID=UPI0020BD5113|nr:hypothetical protein [Pseudoalteromonas sp. 2CM32C]MCK8120103.1 hypothetical protein [Pseudoalteromonas sp. 2CM32C]
MNELLSAIDEGINNKAEKQKSGATPNIKNKPIAPSTEALLSGESGAKAQNKHKNDTIDVNKPKN